MRLEPPPDFIGLAGSGEPTLHARIGDLIAGIKALTRIPVAVITNGSLLWMPEVRAGIAEADLVMPSLDAGSRFTFDRVNRPHQDVGFETMVDGLVTFAAGFKGRLWLEVFVLRGISDTPDEIARMASIAARVRPDRVQLNTVSRPPAEDHALAVSSEWLARVQSQFAGPCEVIADHRSFERVGLPAGRNAELEILALLNRRPSTVEGIAGGLGLPPNEVIKHLDALVSAGAVRAARRERDVFYAGTRTRDVRRHVRRT
jgi:wyosine [tRNA(Phe)-imidazoG37] synthetase (radical SAM superfamily)